MDFTRITLIVGDVTSDTRKPFMWDAASTTRWQLGMLLLTHGRPSLSVQRARLHSSRFVFQSLTHIEKNHKLREKSLKREGLWRKWSCVHKAWYWTYLGMSMEDIHSAYQFVGRLYMHVPIRRKYFSIHNTSSILPPSTNISHLTFLTQNLTICLIKK
jgi:hypothetical protein